MYEHCSHPLLNRAGFLRRIRSHLLLAFAFVGLGLGLGVFGYHYMGHLAWIDALLNASMILSGMGPVDTLQNVAGKLFASFYALFSGFVFIVVASILVAPFAHRVLHRLHLEDKDVSK